MPSTVVISHPWTLAASMVHASIGTPSTCTVQAPQEESSHPRFDPVRSKSCRSTSSSRLLGCTANSWLRPLTRSSMSSFFMAHIPLVKRNRRVNLARPAIDSSAQRLHVFKSLLPQPDRHIHRTHAVMANHHNAIFRIEFLVEARGNIAHRDMFTPGDVGGVELPRLTHIEQCEILTSILHGLYFSNRNLVIHRAPTMSDVTLFPLPLWPAMLQMRLDAFMRIGSFHQLIEVNLLGARQALIKVDRVPRVQCLLGQSHRGRTELPHARDTLFDQRFWI